MNSEASHQKSSAAKRTGERCVIINADDFGLSEGTNAGIIRAHEQGVLTSTSLMVRWPAASQAANYARHNLRLSVGLHLDLAEWIFRDGEWRPLYEVVPTDDATAIEHEVAKQIETFQTLVGRDPTHLDSHQHVHRNEPAKRLVLEAGRRLGVPVRSFDSQVCYCGDFYGQDGESAPYPEGITITAFLKLLDELPSGWTELGCHPGADKELDSVYRSERLQEMEVLCDPRVRAAIESRGIKICSFADIREPQGAAR